MQKQPSRGAVMKRCPENYAASPQENNHTKLRPQQSHPAAFLSHTPTQALPHKSTAKIPQNTLPQQHPERTASMYIQKSKLI